MRTLLPAALGAMSIAVGGLTSPAQAAQPTAACTDSSEVTISPGLTLMRTTEISGTTGGETGVIFCVGSIDGHQITGPGRVGLEAVGRGTCAGGEVSGTLSMTLPTSEGLRHVQMPFNAHWVGNAGTGTSPGREGVFTFVPLEGDCVTTPATRARLVHEHLFYR